MTIAETRIPVDRFWLTGIVVLAAAVLWALYRYTRFGLSTRAASESEASAMLAGISPDRLALTNAVLATTVAGGMGILAAAVTQIDTVVVPLQVLPALGAALFARFTSFAITCLAGLLIGVAQSLLYYASTQGWFPTDDGLPLPGINAMLTFVVIVVALWLRGSSLPMRGELVEARLPLAPRPGPLLPPALLAVAAVVVALFVLPFELRHALTVSMAGMVICLSYVVITGLRRPGVARAGRARGRGRAHRLARSPRRRPGLPGRGGGRRRGRDRARPRRRGVGAARARREPRGRDARRRRRDRAVRLHELHLGHGRLRRPCRTRRSSASTSARAPACARSAAACPARSLGLLVLAVVVAPASCSSRACGRAGSAGGCSPCAPTSGRRPRAGVSVRHTKFAAYTLSSAIAGVGGVLYGYALGSVSLDRFGSGVALEALAFAYVGGISVVSGAVLGGLMTADGVIPHFLEAQPRAVGDVDAAHRRRAARPLSSPLPRRDRRLVAPPARAPRRLSVLPIRAERHG